MTETTAPAGVPAPSLQIIGAGFGRTGTMSMRLALVRLGFVPCDHMLEYLEHPERLALWDVAFRHKLAGQPIDWRRFSVPYHSLANTSRAWALSICI